MRVVQEKAGRIVNGRRESVVGGHHSDVETLLRSMGEDAVYLLLLKLLQTVAAHVQLSKSTSAQVRLFTADDVRAALDRGAELAIEDAVQLGRTKASLSGTELQDLCLVQDSAERDAILAEFDLMKRVHGCATPMSLGTIPVHRTLPVYEVVSQVCLPYKYRKLSQFFWN